MWRNHRSVFKDHLKYIRNNIVKQFHFIILRYADHVQDMHDLAKYQLPTLTKGDSFEEAS